MKGSRVKWPRVKRASIVLLRVHVVNKAKEQARTRSLNNYRMSESAAMGEADTCPGLL